MIDLILGLPETADGFNGILVIIEFITRFKSIRSKSANEVASILIEYIGLFGPFEELLSDQGREFCNNVLINLKTNLGFKHITTSAYNPRTNGITERFNQTLANCLRKHAEADVSNWHKFLPYVIIAYQSRVHSATGYTPFELMFGRNMIPFNDYSTEKEDSNAIFERSKEIKQLFESTRPLALGNLKEFQERQIKSQNNSTNVVEKRIEIGKTVFLKCEGLLNKLEPRFKGPYKVSGHSKRGNYIIKNALNETLKDSYPRHKIKLVEDDSSLPVESAEIERIQKHKTIDNDNLYLVKWKYLPLSESSWIPEKYFNNLKLINDYKSGLQFAKSQRPKRKCTLSKAYFVSFLFLFSIIPSVFSEMLLNSKEINLNGSFKVCSHSYLKNIVNINSLCKTKPKHSNKILNQYFEITPDERVVSWEIKLNVLGKMDYQVYGNGFHCMQKKHILITSMSFWGEKFESLRTEPVKLTRNECKIMVITKKCKESPMNCDADYCTYSANPKAAFSWLKERKSETFSCSFSTKVITAKNQFDHLFGLNCQIKNLFCYLPDSIIIWDETIYHECPLYKITLEKFKFDVNNDILISESYLAAQASGVQVICNISVLTTVEGIYLSKKLTKDISNNVPQGSTVEKMKKLLVAESDYKVFEDIKQKNDIIYDICLNFKSMLNLFSKNEDKYLTHFLKDGSSITFYTTMGTIYKADCLPVNEIKILTDTRKENSSQCFSDQPLIFNIKNTSKTGFLTYNNIIRLISDLVPCNRMIQYIHVINQNYTVVRKSFQSSVVPNSKIQYFNFNYLTNKMIELDTHHNPLLLDGIDLLSTFQEVINHEI